jgi:hypothetical protein
MCGAAIDDNYSFNRENNSLTKILTFNILICGKICSLCTDFML